MTTVKKVFKSGLCSDYARKAIKNCPKKLLNREVNDKMTLSIALATCFHWEETPEGDDFWLSVFIEANEVGN